MIFIKDMFKLLILHLYLQNYSTTELLNYRLQKLQFMSCESY